MSNPKISDCETVLKKQASAIRAAAATLKGAVKLENKDVGGKSRKVPVTNADTVKKADAQYRAACVAAGSQYELMRKWFEHGKNAAVNDFEKAGGEWAKTKKEVDAAVDPTDFGIVKLLKEMNKK
jgi:hypothetical protein